MALYHCGLHLKNLKNPGKSWGQHQLGAFSKISDKCPQNCQDNKKQGKSQLKEA